MKLIRKSNVLWEVPMEGRMRVPGRIFANERMIEEIRREDSFTQVVNVAHLPGIVGYSWAMPDIHVGYGFPIGGVAATSFDEGGVVSPGGVGYDINCGVRLIASRLRIEDVREHVGDVVRSLFHDIPSGPSPHDTGFGELSARELRSVLEKGARYVVESGLGGETDLEFCEEGGVLSGADPDAVSEHAIERGRRQLGSLGSGNHFLEIGYVKTVFDPDAAKTIGLSQGQVTIMIHCGSRGLGHQVCADYLKTMSSRSGEFAFDLPDRQLAAAPLDSNIGRSYLAAMAASANYAWANRQTLMVLAERSVAKALRAPIESLGFRLVYDVCHNIAKIENHTVGGKEIKLCVHRKGATRAIPPGDARIPARYRPAGQPVLVPGDMGTASYVLVGAAAGDEHPFYSSCHGAGRVLSRTAALKKGQGRSLTDELKNRGVIVLAKDRRTLAEEMPEAYKDVSEVVDVLQDARITRKVAEIRPIGVIKG
jgi:tRNA-splicing ligase RtcB (3'-phosphate/5'-hydroxy nucleic acid ligase)